MANGRIPIRIDPYFDGESGQPTNQPLIQPNTGGAVQIAPGPVQVRPGYVDAGAQQLANGRTVASVMRPGPEGLRGTVIPHSTPGGIPAGTRPHETANVEVNVDPHLVGQSARVRLGTVTPDSVAAAEQMAREVTPDPYDVITQRLRASAVLQGIAAQTGQPVGNIQQYQLPPTTPMTLPGNIPGEHLGAIATPAPTPVTRRTRPLARFQQEPADQYMGRPLRQIDMGPSSQPPEYGAPPPQILVTYEIEGFGVHQARYHDVIEQPGFMVLVYNQNFRGGVMYEPPTGESTPPLAVEVEGAPEVHLVHTTGFSYSYGGYRFCILMIERSAPAEEAVPSGV